MRVHSKTNQQTAPINTVVDENVTVWIIELLDASGSMDEVDRSNGSFTSKYQVAEQGINQKIEELKKDKNSEKYQFGAIEFDTNRYKQTIAPQPLKEVKRFSGIGAYGGTPLYEATAKTINEILALKKSEDRVLLSIYTDGEENSSRGEWSGHHGAIRLNQLIEKVKKDDKFTVTFVGTEFDVDRVVKDLGIKKGNTLAYDGTARGMKMSMDTNIGSTIAFADDVVTRGVDTTDNFYSKSVDEK